MEKKATIPVRSEVPEKDKWAIEDIYSSDARWEEDFEKLKNEIDKIAAYEGRLQESGETLLEALKLSDEISKIAENVYVYANQKLHEDTANAVYQDFSGKAQVLMVMLSEATAYMEPELLGISEETLRTYMEESEELAVYRQFFHNMLRKKSHVLSREMEGLLAKVDEVTDAPSSIFSMFNNADLKFGEIQVGDTKRELSHGNFISFMENQDREIRKAAFEKMYASYSSYKNTLAATFQANIKQSTFYAGVRKYGSSLEAALDGSNIPVSVYDTLIDTVHKYLPLLHRYMELRKKVLKLDELHMYDIYVPMIAETDMKISYEEAKGIVKEGLHPLGDHYLEVLQEGFDNRWIDVYENQGKRSGAYSWGAYGTHPYVLLNHQDNLNSTFTLAHEMGHALHSYFSDEKQPYIYAGYKIFVAEVASTCNESLLIHHMIENAEDLKEKAYLLNYFLEQFRGTVYRQTMFAEFEKLMHQKVENGETLTADVISAEYYQLNQDYYGAAVNVDQDVEMEWARIPHFYTPFYVYQYATGFSAAIAISKKILEGDTSVKEGYMKFLSSGSSLYPLDLLKLCQVDMTSPETVDNALKVFESYLTELETICDKILQ